MNMRLFCGFATILRSVRCIRWTNNSCRLKSISSCSLFPPLTFINFHQRKASFLSLFFYTWMKLDCSFLSSLSMAILRTAWRLCHLELSFICFLFGSFLVSVFLFFFRCRYFIHGQSASLLHTISNPFIWDFSDSDIYTTLSLQGEGRNHTALCIRRF